MNKIFGILLLGLFILVSCNKDELNDVALNSVNEPTPAFTEQSEAEIYDNVKVFSDTDNEALRSLNEETLVFAKTAKVESVEIGDILTSGIAPKAPYGYMRRIVSISDNGQEIEFTTADADLNEVFESANVHILKRIAPEQSDIANAGSAKNVDDDGYFRIKIEASTIGGAFIEGQVRIRPDFEFVWEKNNFSPFPRRVKTLISADLQELELVGRIGVKAKLTLAKIDLPPITLFLGPVPVVFKNALKLDMTGKVRVGSTLDGGAFFEQGDFSAGLEYVEGQGWEGLGHWNVDFEFTRPTEISPAYELRLEFPDFAFESAPYNNKNFKFYARAYPATSIVYTEPQITIDVVPRLRTGIKSKFFGIFETDYSYTYDFPSYLLYEGTIDDLPEFDFNLFDNGSSNNSENLSDITGNWAETEIRYFVDEGFMAGYPDNTFRPEQSLTRAEFAVMLVNVLDPPPSTDPTVASRSFNDISGHWAEAKILRAARAGFMAGYPDGSFRPNQQITRTEVLVTLAANVIENGDTGDLNDFNDGYQIANWARQRIADAYTNQLIVNYPNPQYLRPTSNATRADVVAFLYRLLIWEGDFVNAYENPYLVVAE